MRVLLPFTTLAFAVSLQAQPADLVLRNGKIVTMNPAAPTAQAIAVRGGKITALGADSAAPRWIGPNTKVIDLHGMLAIPGFIEGHGHFTGVGEFRMGLDLREARTWDDIVAQVGRAGQVRHGCGRPRMAHDVALGPPDAEVPATRFLDRSH
jgi:predicted amidohydrolase YtcJ